MTWAEFTSIVREHLLENSTRLGVQKFIERHIKNAVRDIQHFVPFYQQGHETVFHADDLTRHGQASVGTMPEEAFPLTLEVQRISQRCRAQPVMQWPIEHLRELICGNVTVGSGCRYWLAFDEHGKSFTVFPQIDEGYQIVLGWDGVRSTFDDDEEVPFNEEVAYAAAEWVMWKLTPDVDKTPNNGAAHAAAYYTQRRKLVREAQDRVRLRRETTPPDEVMADSCANTVTLECEGATVNATDDQIEVMLLGNSGNAVNIDDTEAVSMLVNRNDPDLLIHLGNTNYPTGSAITIHDNFSKWYYGWLNKAYAAWGNVDDSSDSGAPMFEAMTHLAGLNSGKRYYQFTSGQAEFFVMHWQNEADGLGENDIQGQWLEAALAASTAAWKIVIAHASPWTSDSVNTPGNATLRYPFSAWGAHLLITAGGLTYERGIDPTTRFPWIVAGLGGAPLGAFGVLISGSQFRYADNYGALRLAISLGRLEATFLTVDNEVIDRIVWKNGLEEEDPDSCDTEAASSVVTPTSPCVVCLDSGGSDKLIVRDTTAEMRAVTTYGPDYFFVTLGGAVKGDLTRRLWYFDPDSFEVDDGLPDTAIIRFDSIPASSPGRLHQWM